MLCTDSTCGERNLSIYPTPGRPGSPNPNSEILSNSASLFSPRLAFVPFLRCLLVGDGCHNDWQRSQWRRRVILSATVFFSDSKRCFNNPHPTLQYIHKLATPKKSHIKSWRHNSDSFLWFGRERYCALFSSQKKEPFLNRGTPSALWLITPDSQNPPF